MMKKIKGNLMPCIKLLLHIDGKVYRLSDSHFDGGGRKKLLETPDRAVTRLVATTGLRLERVIMVVMTRWGYIAAVHIDGDLPYKLKPLCREVLPTDRPINAAHAALIACVTEVKNKV